MLSKFIFNNNNILVYLLSWAYLICWTYFVCSVNTNIIIITESTDEEIIGYDAIVSEPRFVVLFISLFI